MAIEPEADADQADAEVLNRRTADSSERAYHSIRQMLVDFRLKPEERINEVRLSRALNLSRTPVREALNRLASEGFVSLTPNRGFFVRALSIEGLLDLYELRIIVESAAFRLMCQRADDESIAALVAYWDMIEPGYSTRDPDEVLLQDERFHLMIAEASGNSEIVGQLEAINARIRFIRRIQIEHVSHSGQQITAHRSIVKAASERDAEAGVVILGEHIEMTVSATKRALKDALLRAYAPDTDPAIGKRAARRARSI